MSEEPLCEVVCLNPLDCDLDIDLSSSGLRCSKLSADGFGYMWGGSRGNVGLTRGRACFSVRILRPLPVTAACTDDLSTAHIARVGVSWASTAVGLLGEVRCDRCRTAIHVFGSHSHGQWPWAPCHAPTMHPPCTQCCSCCRGTQMPPLQAAPQWRPPPSALACPRCPSRPLMYNGHGMRHSGMFS